MLKMKFWFEGNQLQPDCNIHGGCKIGSSACHACPHCVRVNSKDQEVLCLGDGSEYKEAKLEELRVGDRFKTVKNVCGTLYTVREIKNGSIRLSYNIYEHLTMVTQVWLNGKESKELLSTIQQWLDNNQE